MTPLLPLADAISQRLDSFAAERMAEARPLGAEAEGFVGAGAATLRGGKRLRGRFCATGWRAVAGGEGALPAHVIDASAALELFQSAALVHDDIIDNSDTRRGGPSAHRVFESRHAASGWTGDGAAFGRSAAILLGDLLLAWSGDLFEHAISALGERAAAARAEYGRMRREVMVGQFLDVAEESAWPTVPDEEHAARAVRVATMKSARYSVQQPLLIGAAIAGGDEAGLAALAAFGHPLGLAFQLRDDVLGVFGDTRTTGKPAGDDLREGKRTLLIAYAREAAGASGRAEVDALLGDPGLDEHDIERLRSTIAGSGALDRVEGLIEQYATDAAAALDDARLDDTAAAELRDLLRAATERTA